MNRDQVIGTAKNLGGKAQEAFGKVTGDTKSQVEGVINQAAGAAQDLYGQAKETASDAAQASATARWMLRIMSAIRSKNVLTQRRSSRFVSAFLLVAWVGAIGRPPNRDRVVQASEWRDPFHSGWFPDLCVVLSG